MFIAHKLLCLYDIHDILWQSPFNLWLIFLQVVFEIQVYSKNTRSHLVADFESNAQFKSQQPPINLARAKSQINLFRNLEPYISLPLASGYCPGTISKFRDTQVYLKVCI